MLKMKSSSKQHYDCADIEKLAQQYVDGQLNAQQNRLFEEHLEYCLPCDKKIQFEIKLKEIVRKKGKEALPPQEIKIKLKKILTDLNDLH